MTIKQKFENFFNRRIPQNSFIRNITTLVSGTVFAQVLAILVSPILTRLYSPESFGLFSYYISILGLISVIVCWRYELAIVIPEDTVDAANIFFVSIVICCLMTALTLVFAFLFGNNIAELLDTASLSIWLLFIPISVFFIGIYNVFNYWCVRRKNFKYLAVRQITQSSVTAGSQIGFGFISKINFSGLIGGYIIGQVVAAVRMGYNVIKNDGRLLVQSLNLSLIKKNISKYKKFPLFDTWSSLFNTSSTLFIPLLFGFFFNSVAAGFWGLANRIIALPMSVIGSAVSQVFFQKAASIKEKKEELQNLTESFFKFLFSLSYIPFTILFVSAPYLFSVIFGNEWQTAGLYVRYMCPWAFLVLCSSPLSSLFNILNKQHISLVFNIFTVITRLSAVVICGIYYDALMAAKIFGMVCFVNIIISILYIFFIAQINLFQILKFMTRQILEMLVFVSPIVFVVFVFNNDLAITFIAVLMVIAFLATKVKGIMKTNSFLFAGE